jgi:hypothetical protein
LQKEEDSLTFWRKLTKKDPPILQKELD